MWRDDGVPGRLGFGGGRQDTHISGFVPRSEPGFAVCDGADAFGGQTAHVLEFF